MMIGRKFPENVRAFRLLLEELLRPIFSKLQLGPWVIWRESFILWLSSSTWEPKGEADWPLYVLADKEMLVMFFAAGQHNYALYGLYYARSIGAMPAKLQDQFMKGQHTMHHKPGIKCSCNGEKSWNTQRFSCSSSGMTCTVFCHCKR